MWIMLFFILILILFLNFLIKKKIIDFSKGNTLDLVVENKCNFYEPISFPCRLTIGFSVKKIGNTSVTYLLGVIKRNKLIADGYIVHVFVDRKTYQPKKINQKFRKILESIIGEKNAINFTKENLSFNKLWSYLKNIFSSI